jgi:hypothetical protein
MACATHISYRAVAISLSPTVLYVLGDEVGLRTCISTGQGNRPLPNKPLE